MKILYLLPILPPKIPEAEAISQEIALLRQHHPGPIVHINPNQYLSHLPSPVRLPRLVFGWHQLRQLRALAADADVCHFYNPDPYPFGILKWLGKPVVYSLTGSLGHTFNRAYFAKMDAITTLNPVDLAHLQQRGFTNIFLATPSVDLTRFTHTVLPLQPDGPIHLMMASAPWTLAQFRSKGVDALLAAAQQNPRLHITFLWRGHLFAEMQQRVTQANLQSRIAVIDGAVDVNAVLAKVHASIVLAEGAQIVKAYPQSLLDSLAAGKPTLVSRVIPFADYVTQHGCGQVIETVSASAVLQSLAALEANYAEQASAALAVAQTDFSPTQTVAAFTTAYQHATGGL